MSENASDLITVYVDDIPVQVAKGTNLIEVATQAGREVPHYCYHPKLSISGNCRMCLVEMGMPGRDRATGEPMLNEDGTPKIMWVPKPVIACATTATPGMHMRTNSDIVKECREGVMEFLLVNHPLDCPICDQAGECRLQEFATDYGRGYSRFGENKNVKPKRTRLGPRVMLDDERCILCSRCIRFSEEIAEDPVLGFIDRGSYSTLTCFPGKELANNYSLNTVDICPVGALTSTDFRFKMRVWFLKETPSICTESSVGCNTVVGSREGIIYRITPRRNDAVNDTWMPDSGRELYKQVEADNRLLAYSLDGKPCSAQEAIAQAAQYLKDGPTAIVGSGRGSVEEQYLLKRIADALPEGTRTYLVSRTGEGDGKLLSADRNPNVRGALVTGLIDQLPEAKLDDLRTRLENGEIKTVFAVREDLSAAGIPCELLKKVNVVYLGTHSDDTCQRAKVELPALTVFEHAGTFVNQQFRLQKFQQAVPGPAGVQFGYQTLVSLLATLSDTQPLSPSAQGLWEQVATAHAALQGITWAGIPEVGLPLDSSAWQDLPFCETAGLHFEPKAALAGA